MRIVSKSAKRLMNLWLENKQRDIMDFVSTRFCYTAKTLPKRRHSLPNDRFSLPLGCQPTAIRLQGLNLNHYLVHLA